MQVTISGDSPFADCRTTGEGRNYRGAEVEPWIAVNPVDSANMIVVWQQDRWSNGAARGLVTSVTHDGGATWRTITHLFSSFAACGASGAENKLASDSCVGFGMT